MKTKSILITITGLLVAAGFASAQAVDLGPCGQERGTCGNECTGDGFLNQGRGQGNGQGKGARSGPQDGSGKGVRRGQEEGPGKGLGRGQGKGQRSGPRDGSGPGCP